MCGIYGLLTATGPTNEAFPEDALFTALDQFLRLSASLTSDGADAQGAGQVSELAAAVAELRRESRHWTSCAAFLALEEREGLAERLAGAVARLDARLAELASPELALDSADREALNRVIVAGRDVAWQLDKDARESLDEARGLLGRVTPLGLSRIYDLNLLLRSIDRLEVRGRDSAGVSVYVRFPTSDAIDLFLEQTSGAESGQCWRSEIEGREDFRLGHRSILRVGKLRDTLLFAYKVAGEVGRMGDNVAYLRQAIREDPFFQTLLQEEGLRFECLSHTRWASNGVVSVPNCHPVDSTVRGGKTEGLPLERGAGRFVACLNGDIDNYRELVDRYVHAEGLSLDPAITTDAKIIPIVVERHYERLGDLALAVRAALDEFEGSMAIGILSADHPGEITFAQKGSGQGLFFGLGDESLVVASEMYGVVELTARYVKAVGSEEGEIFRIRQVAEGPPCLELLGDDGFAPVPEDRVQEAEITTRDINRGRHPHFFRKEINESVESVRNTIRGKYRRTPSSAIEFLLGEEMLPSGLIESFQAGKIRQVYVVGQGTASVAGQGIAHLLEQALLGSPSPVRVIAEKGTEFSAHRLHDDLSDTLVVAVSQSGTTTDTNRTVDLARQRGAWILGIVNRRNSDLVYKSHGVIYTSDGRDVEMSVASTKAFYAQNVAGQILALALGSRLSTMNEGAIRREVERLEELPAVMEETLALDGAIQSLAELALSRRHWAVVGSGPGRVAADEIRIKLSELCYKSIAVDYTEDKKHIDLSSEPFIVICCAGQRPEIVSDTVKEVAIFRAHQARPLVLTGKSERGFDPYAEGVVRLPEYEGRLGFLPMAIAGHLLGYHVAVAMDRYADKLRFLRGAIVAAREEQGFEGAVAADVLDSLSPEVARVAAEFDESLREGSLEAALSARYAARLANAFQLLTGRLSVDGYARTVAPGSSLLFTLLDTLSDGVSELARPVDAIKHQAKTVTVGISRGASADGPLFTRLTELEISRDRILESHRQLLRSLEPLVSEVEGHTLYALEGLDALGRPLDGSAIRVVEKGGSTAGLRSRCEQARDLAGNKWHVVKSREIYLGLGQHDGRKILILPIVEDATEGHLLLLHIALRPKGRRDDRLRALRARQGFLDRLKAAVTERDIAWRPELIDDIENDDLFFFPAERVAEEMAKARSTS